MNGNDNDYGYDYERAPSESRLGLISMIFGIIGLAGITAEFSIAAIILAFSARRRDGGFRTKSRLGLIFGIAGIVIGILAGIAVVAGFLNLDAWSGFFDGLAALAGQA